MNAKDTEPLDVIHLSQFIGTAQYWRVARQFAITDGVKYLAETAACFWLIDAAISHLLELGTADWFVLVRTEVSGSQATMIYEDGNGLERARQAIPYTDLQLPSVDLYAVWDRASAGSSCCLVSTERGRAEHGLSQAIPHHPSGISACR